MDKLNIGYDDNLGLPSDFSDKVGCQVLSYHDLSLLLRAFEHNELDAVFVPAGALPYVHTYELAAQALTSEKKLLLQSNMVSAQPLNTAEIPDLTLGCVNQYCTTSYWAPMIYLMNCLPQGAALSYQYTDGFIDLLHRAGQNEIGCAMVWDAILRESIEDASKVSTSFSLSHLPAPVLLVQPGIRLPDHLFSYESQDNKAFFIGFKAPEKDSLSHFLKHITKAQKYFKISRAG